MKGSAQRETVLLEETASLAEVPAAGVQERDAELALSHEPAAGDVAEPVLFPELRQQAAERLAAHRERRARLAGNSAQQPAQLAGTPAPETRKNRIAAAVAERYAQTPSYRAFLAAEAARATQQAAAAAEVAARNAQAVRAVQQELLAELELWTAPQEFSDETATLAAGQREDLAPAARRAVAEPAARPSRRVRFRGEQPAEASQADEAPVREVVSRAGLTVRLYEDAGYARASAPARTSIQSPAAGEGRPLSEEEARALDELDEEIAFRQAPVFEPFTIAPLTPLPANLLEFPRQLVATRKVRPRLAEGPLREDTPRSPQLRIFEVEPDQIAQEPAEALAAPEWTSMRLEAQPQVEFEATFHVSLDALPTAEHLLTESLPQSPRTTLATGPAPGRPQTAAFSLQMMAGAVDLALVLFALLGCVAGCAHLTGWLPTGVEAAAVATATALLLYTGYYLLFFTLSDQTPGMRYARIGLCTFGDENPSRAAMRRRLLAQLVAITPLGVGLLWALLDDEGLGWHDRISGMYQRAY